MGLSFSHYNAKIKDKKLSNVNTLLRFIPFVLSHEISQFVCYAFVEDTDLAMSIQSYLSKQRRFLKHYREW